MLRFVHAMMAGWLPEVQAGMHTQLLPSHQKCSIVVHDHLTRQGQKKGQDGQASYSCSTSEILVPGKILLRLF